MAKKSQVLDHLSNVPLFTACSKKELQLIAKASDQISLPEGHELTRQDSSSREAFVIMEGAATVRRNNRKITTLGPGAVIGELGLLDRGPRTATVVADGPMEVLVLGPREFSALLDEVPPIAHKIMKSLAARVRDLDTKTFG